MFKRLGIPVVLMAIRFKSGDHFPVVRRKHFTMTEIFAFTGGLLGLFLGISVISLAEVINLFLQPLFGKLASSPTRPSRIKTKRKRFFEIFGKAKSYFSFFLKESSIHSFNFIVNARNCFESMFWLLTFVLSMTGCTFMILQLYWTMDFKSVTLIIDDQLIDVSEIPFPAVTVFASFPSVFKLRYPELESLDVFDFVSFTNPIFNDDYELDESIFETLQHPTSRYVDNKSSCRKLTLFSELQLSLWSPIRSFTTRTLLVPFSTTLTMKNSLSKRSNISPKPNGSKATVPASEENSARHLQKR